MSNNYQKNKILGHWDSLETESMYDKYLLNLEINLISKFIKSKTKILDAGCGEGEGTLAYSKIPGTQIHAADFSDTRLNKAKALLSGAPNVVFHKIDFTEDFALDIDFDCVISQRFLINITDFSLQCKVLSNLIKILRPGGKIILLEGYSQGVNELNKIRNTFNLDSIPVKWHNLFLDDKKLVSFFKKNNLKLIAEDGLGEYFLLTRCIKPAITEDLNWDDSFNLFSSSTELRKILNFKQKFSRLKMWVFQK